MTTKLFLRRRVQLQEIASPRLDAEISLDKVDEAFEERIHRQSSVEVFVLLESLVHVDVEVQFPRLIFSDDFVQVPLVGGKLQIPWKGNRKKHERNMKIGSSFSGTNFSLWDCKSFNHFETEE